MGCQLALKSAGLLSLLTLVACSGTSDPAVTGAPAANTTSVASPDAVQNGTTAGSPNPDSTQSMPGVTPDTYTQSTGKKSDPGTACSTARTKPDGSLDCGMSGKPITPTHAK